MRDPFFDSQRNFNATRNRVSMWEGKKLVFYDVEGVYWELYTVAALSPAVSSELNAFERCGRRNFT